MSLALLAFAGAVCGIGLHRILYRSGFSNLGAALLILVLAGYVIAGAYLLGQ